MKRLGAAPSRAFRHALKPPSVCSAPYSHAAPQAVPRSVAKLLEWKPDRPVEDVVVNGFIRSVRSMKSAYFLHLGDGSSRAPLQAVLPANQANGLDISIGAAVRLKGAWIPSPGAGQSHELHVKTAAVLGPSDAKTFPIQRKYQTPDYLRTMPHLRTRTPFNSTLLRFRSEVIAFLGHFFASHDFVQTHPPIITSSDCEGAGEVFTVSPASQLPPSSDGSETSSLFFRSPKYLTVSSQLHLEALAQSVGSVWTLSPTFRAERSDTSRHLSEFYMLEAEVCFVEDLEGVMTLLEDLLRSLSTSLRGAKACHELLQLSSGPTDRTPVAEVEQRWDGLAQLSWPRLTYTDAIGLLQSATNKFSYEPEWGAALQSEHEKYIATVVGKGKPVFVTHYPRDIKPFYMMPSSANPSDGRGEANVSGPTIADDADRITGRRTVDCFDLLVPELCEIAGGSMREYRLPQLLDAMQLYGLAPSGREHPASNDHSHTHPETVLDTGAGTLDWYADLRRWGCPPHGGFGLGFDRLIGYLSGVQTLRDVVAFPRWHGRCDC